ncbi:hypothetical protein [Ornithinibacillus xuwenensis]|uniref:Uncharacterized protein n=1 Tax=Ornithinibacillus xuwenensis TaxID=3144668 RepID=A0ABU9XIV1_9BACI
MKPMLYQIFAMAVIWIGMVFFYQEMDQVSKFIFYLVSSWLLLLIVLFVKQILRKRNQTN